MRPSQGDIELAWERVVYDCGCPDLYYCPASLDVECPRHSGFGICCDRLDEHLPLPPGVRAARPRPPLPPDQPADPLTG